MQIRKKIEIKNKNKKKTIKNQMKLFVSHEMKFRMIKQRL